jgi:hypothetical protein
MPPVPDYHTGGFVIYRQTYFGELRMSRNGYAGLWELRNWKIEDFIPTS